MNAQDIDALRSVRAGVAACRDAPADRANEEFAPAMARLIAVRNAQLSAADGAAHALLPQLNAILSLMAGIEFPLAGFHRERIDSVIGALDRVLAACAAPVT